MVGVNLEILQLVSFGTGAMFVQLLDSL